MLDVTDVGELRSLVAVWRAQRQRIVFVPTMGNLHAGHLALVKRARELGQRVIVSIFVNPTQFAPGEDYETYPRTPEADRRSLAELGVDLVFVPDVETVYPDGALPSVTYRVPAVGRDLEAEFRPGFFAGVVTVVKRLFELVEPDVAVFGEKDYQQLAVVRAMVRELGMAIKIVGVATVREPDGLALSSRNQYLSAEQRARAPLLYRTLCEVAAAVRKGGISYATLEHAAARKLEAGGFEPDYVRIRHADTLLPVSDGERCCVVLAAARLGPARLIDNVRV
ncbi:MAG: pantoate--beta-alanine ligase [Gammaproteobacteria bacterium]|jgi:pantoate--beta-alanine ligase